MGKKVLKSVVLKTGDGLTRTQDVLIEGNLFSKIADSLAPEDMYNAEVIQCEGFALLPAFYNGHTHAAMSLLRGYADDMELNKWLREYIWPFEAKLGDKDIEVGSRLAVLEMIKSGTVFFADMYWHREQTMKVVEEMGVRASIGVTIAEQLTSPENMKKNMEFLKAHVGESDRVKLCVMPHSMYTNGEGMLRRCVEIAKAENYRIHTHLSETLSEVEQCQRQFGCTPVELFERVGAIDERFSAAHCVHFTEDDRKRFADAGATAVMCPCSNLKLSSGMPQVTPMIRDGVNLALGTDGASSNNSLDMHQEMKLAALLAKVNGSADSLPAEAALKMATVNVARAFGLANVGEIREGFVADGLLVDLNNERMTPCHDLVSNWVYAADNSSIDSVICNGNFVMRGRHVDGEEDIKEAARACAKRLANA